MSESPTCFQPYVDYVAPSVRERMEQDEKVMVLTPWTVQNICYEVIKNYMMENPPKDQGYAFQQVYDPDDTRTGIGLEIAYHYKDAVVQKRPGIYVSRGPAEFKFPTINQLIGGNIRESEKMRYSLVEMPLNLAVVSTNVGFTEQLAEYIFKIFLRYQEIIKNDFCLRQFKLASITPPQLYLESKDHIYVNIGLMAAFDMGAVVRQDNIKLKTITYTVFTNCLERPLPNQ